jgi:hypothetical protein
MLKRNHHNFHFVLMRSQNGAALLIFLAMILIAVTAVTVSQLSLNTQVIQRAKSSVKSLSYSREVLLGNALNQPIPGRLPCPDTNNDGESDLTPGGFCVSYRGLFPYKTLGVARQVDGVGQPLWYVVDSNYAGNITAAHNSSRSASLQINGNQSFAFILIASNIPLLNQSPVLTPPLDATQFLEGDNGDATLNSYSNLKDDTHNDLLLGVSTLDFWMVVERRVLDDAKKLMENYRTACTSPTPWPWAATFNSGTSLVNTYEGSLPLETALPIDWQTGCAASVTPGYLETHWNGILYYAICKDAVPVNPPVTSCLTIGSETAKVIILSPGSVVGTQIRCTLINQFFENDDSSQHDNQFDLLIPGATDNDLLIIIEP